MKNVMFCNFGVFLTAENYSIICEAPAMPFDSFAYGINEGNFTSGTKLSGWLVWCPKKTVFTIVLKYCLKMW